MAYIFAWFYPGNMEEFKPGESYDIRRLLRIELIADSLEEYQQIIGKNFNYIVEKKPRLITALL